MIALMYHDVVPPGGEDASGFPGRDAARYKVTTALFDEHLSAIAGLVRGVPPGSPAPSAPPAAPALRPPMITFDDGGASALTAADGLEGRGLRGCFLVTTNFIGTNGFLDRRAVRELSERGHEVGSHSCSHPLRMGHCSRSQLLDEWMRSREVISNILGEQITTASVPGGDYALRVAETAAQAGFTRLFTSEPTDHPTQIAGLELLGRFTIHRWTSAASVRGLIAGSWQPRARQVVAWNARKISKRIAGDHYLRIRRLLLRHGDDVRWGDSRHGTGLGDPGSGIGLHKTR